MCTCPRRSIIVWSPRQVYCKSRTWRHRTLHTQDAAHAIPVACHSTPKHLLGLVPAACTPLRVPTRYPAPFTHTRDARERAMRSARLLYSGTARLGCRGTPLPPVQVYSLQSTVPPILQPERCCQGFIHLLHSCIRLRRRRHLPRPLVLV